VDRVTLMKDHLSQASRHVSEGLTHVARQQVLITALERRGNTATAEAAKKLLLQFEDVLALHVSERNRLETELAALEAQGNEVRYE